MWIDSDLSVVRKIETTTKKNGTFKIDLYYDDKISAILPSEIKLMFNVSDVQIPKAISGDLNEKNDFDKKRKKDEPMIGNVIVKYKNYKINTGLKDSFFKRSENR